MRKRVWFKAYLDGEWQTSAWLPEGNLQDFVDVSLENLRDWRTPAGWMDVFVGEEPITNGAGDYWVYGTVTK